MVDWFSLPIGANPANDQRVGVDELGNPTYRTIRGQQYTTRQTYRPQRETEPGSFARMRESVGNLVRGATDAFVSGVTAPARAARGEPVTYGDAFETAGMAQLGGAAMPAPRGSLRTFAGRNAANADLDGLARAQRLAADGADRGSIWNDTGWFQGVDGQWRWEIDDSGFRVAENAMNRVNADGTYGSNFGSIFPHREVLGAYADSNPFWGDVDLSLSTSPRGQYLGDTDAIRVFADSPEDFRSIGLHEIQHAVQSREGFVRGSSPTLELALSRNPTSYDEAYDAYRRAAGEVEARNVQTRANFTPDQRRATPPWETMDVPEADQIIRYGSGSQASIDPNQVRSRFARFDPRLSHLANLNAANASPVTGLMSATAVSEQDQIQRLAEYLAEVGGL